MVSEIELYLVVAELGCEQLGSGSGFLPSRSRCQNGRLLHRLWELL